MGSANGADRVFNTTTIRYTINQKKGHTSNCSVGTCVNCGNNTPLRSAHPGGINAVFGDGSVRNLATMTDLNTLLYLSARNDGQVVSVP
jgi:prepilin-type processing-associated H-X9-DG protein